LPTSETTENFSFSLSRDIPANPVIIQIAFAVIVRAIEAAIEFALEPVLPVVLIASQECHFLFSEHTRNDHLVTRFKHCRFHHSAFLLAGRLRGRPPSLPYSSLARIATQAQRFKVANIQRSACRERRNVVNGQLRLASALRANAVRLRQFLAPLHMRKSGCVVAGITEVAIQNPAVPGNLMIRVVTVPAREGKRVLKFSGPFISMPRWNQPIRRHWPPTLVAIPR
jgi:hypothetical protein